MSSSPNDSGSKIVYTHTDEAPALATYSLLPIITAFTDAAGVDVETRDISLAGRIIAAFGDVLEPHQRIGDALGELGEWTQDRGANIIKLPNISASVPQLKDAIAELQSKGYAVPDYPDDPANASEREIRERFDRVKGSAVNPVLREGNSDRRAPRAVKEYARQYPHSMGAWSLQSQSHVSTMSGGDFRSNEQSATAGGAGSLSIEHVDDEGNVRLMRKVPVGAGDVVDSTFMSIAALREFLDGQIADARAQEVLFSLHLKATMMKVSDPIVFGHAVRAFFAPVFDRHAEALAAAGADPNDGWANVLAAVELLPAAQRGAVEADIAATLAERPGLAMVDSDRGITNLHVPSDVIVDASMPAMIRSSGQMWNAEGNQHDTKAVIPDSSYAGIYQAVIDDCRANGAYDPTTMGSVPNVGLMAQKAEEYGSHDKTYEVDAAGTMRVTSESGEVLMSHQVAEGDIWRMCTTNDAAIGNWVDLAIERGQLTGAAVVFWLDAERPHDAQLITKVDARLAERRAGDASIGELDIRTLAPADACRFSLERIRRGEDTISVTGNVLRDYNTDLFPILELGTSAKMLSVVPLMAGGGLFETGAGGSAPKHVQQMVAENHLRWDSLGEFLALAVSLEHLARVAANPVAQLLADTLDAAIGTWLAEGRAPSRRVNEPDNRASHFHLAKHWADEMARQGADADLAERFAPLGAALAANENQIIAELVECQGVPVDLGGYYLPDPALAEAAMRPSATFNDILEGFRSGG
ncbi:MAG: NADP-dependent isocitrate dehydrogenase [Acidimicrobiales bacterium]|nr:NADP-dependent isocitrate dehydrogenase [Acidimicrobiales bacterium]MYH75772.1 NADP-dependent isocitrate dehydrogenase [Acidimicrobiales bacterium]MYK70448.1 NADP-dependent isocitrate dehydrogenase [Acidimicrobiales bacterium]